MAKNDAELQTLEHPKSRSEEYLNFLCGRAVDINALPNPYSRVEHYLEYLCHNRGAGGGGQPQPFNGVERVAYDTQNKRLTVTYTNGAIDNLDLANLSDTTEVQYDNNTHIMTVTRNGVATQIDLSKLNTKINNVAPVDGNIQLALNQAGDDISLTVGGQNAGTVSLNGYVKTVNNQPNQAGNVTVNAEHIGYNTSNTNLNFQNVQDVLDYLEEDKASLNKNNVFIGHNTFNEVNLLGKNVFVSTVGGKQNSAHKTGIYCGDRRVSTHHNSSPNPKYISAIKIEVLPSVNVGDMVSGVYVTEIEKKADISTDIVGETIINDGSFIVEEDETGAKVIYVPIQKEYTVDTYFLVGKTGDRNLRESWEGYPPRGEYINNLSINNLPQIGSQLNWIDGNGWIIIHSLTDDEMNVREELKLLKNKVSNAVTSVNKETPIDGDVTINAGHIGYDGNTSNIIATNVQDAIDKLKEDMDLIDSSEVRIVANKTELDNLLGQGILSKGDIVYIIDSNGVIDYTGADVGNNGNPIAMIYDTDIPVPQNNNHLRVFSRFNTPIHITATNVEYDDNNTQLQANNVQGAIEKLKEKVDTGVTSVEYDNNKTLTVVTGGARQEYDLTPLAGIQTINRESGIDGNVNLSIDNTTNNVEFKVDTYTFGTLNYMTDQQADNIINGWSL